MKSSPKGELKRGLKFRGLAGLKLNILNVQSRKCSNDSNQHKIWICFKGKKCCECKRRIIMTFHIDFTGMSQKFEHVIIYYFFQTSRIAGNFGYIFYVGNIILHAKNNYWIIYIDFSGMHEKLECIIIYFIHTGSSYCSQMVKISESFCAILCLKHQCYTYSLKFQTYCNIY